MYSTLTTRSTVLRNTLVFVLLSVLSVSTMFVLTPQKTAYGSEPAPIMPENVGAHINGPFGGVPNPVKTAYDIQAVANAGLDHVRIPVYWSYMSKAPGQLNWLEMVMLDNAVNKADKLGLDIYFVVGSVPSYARPAGSSPNFLPESSFGYYNTFISQVTQRYANKVDAWEIGNELNHFVFAGEAPNPEKYASLLNMVYPTIKNINPSILVVTNGLANEPNNPGFTMAPADYLNRVYLAGAKNSFDVVAIHPYEWYKPGAWSGVDNVRNVMVANGDSAKNMWITEDGAPTDTSHFSDEQQLTYLQQELQQAANRSYITLFTVYNIRDIGTNANDPEQNLGLLNNDYTPKPAYEWLAYTKLGLI